MFQSKGKPTFEEGKPGIKPWHLNARNAKEISVRMLKGRMGNLWFKHLICSVRTHKELES